LITRQEGPWRSLSEGGKNQPYFEERQSGLEIQPRRAPQDSRHLEALILHKTVEIRDYGPGRYNHVLGEIFLDGENINLEMIREGLAEVYQWEPARGPDLNAYQGAEAKAREAGTGMWSLACG